MIDIYATKNLQEFVFELGKGIMNGLKPRGRKAWDLFLSCLSSLRAGISFDFAGNPGWNLEMGDIKTPSITWMKFLLFGEGRQALPGGY